MKKLCLNGNRRSFLKFGTTTLITLSAALTTGCDIFDPKSIDQRLIQTLDHPERAREIGHAFRTLDDTMKTYSEAHLTNELLQWMNIDPVQVQKLSDKKLSLRLSQQIRDDFTNENVVIVDQWMFSRTEAMLCALADAYARSQVSQ